MPLRRPRPETLDVAAFEDALAELGRIREAHETCTETPRDCRAGILWATNSTLTDTELEPGLVRSLLLHHVVAVNDLLERRSHGRVPGLFVAGDRLRAATSARFH